MAIRIRKTECIAGKTHQTLKVAQLADDISLSLKDASEISR